MAAISNGRESAPIDPVRLRDFVRAVYERAGLPGADAALLADSLVQADLWGHQSHGVLRVDWYRQRFLAGTMRASTHATLATDAGAIAVLDGQDGVGQALAQRAMAEAIARAKRHGVGVVAVRDSNHFGTAMYFTRMAAAEGCIGFMSTNASPAMAPWGGIRKLLGNNPWSIAAPVAEFEARMERLVGEIKSAPRAPGVDEIFYPGEIEARNDARQRRAGLELPAATLADLAAVGRESGVAFPSP